VADAPKVALVHDWLVSRGGAERVLDVLHEMWPDAPIYTAAYTPEKFPEFAHADIRTTWLDKISLAKRKHQLFSIPRAWAFRGLDLSEYDIVISSCSAESKYVRTGPNTLHICYCYTPIRYYWSDYDWYRQHPPFGALNPIAKFILPALIGYLRRQDYAMAQKVNVYLTQSKNIQAKIKKYYNRDSTVIHPPTDTSQYLKLKKNQGDFYLIVGRQVAYKRLDLAVDAFNELGLPLVVAGTGEEIAVQRSRAKANIDFRGFVSDDELLQLYADAKAVLYPQDEDYGLVPVEAQAAGTPMIALNRGGAAETVIDGETGVLFDEQSAKALVAAVKRFQTLTFDPAKLREHAKKFDVAVFERQLREFVDSAYVKFTTKH
jgi:glycosyltransferase involved in cell wall biosynthesis